MSIGSEITEDHYENGIIPLLKERILMLGKENEQLKSQINNQTIMGAMNITIGEQRMRVTFNPSLSGDIDTVKQGTAKLINVCENMKPQDGSMMSSEKARLIALAQTAYEEAAMWAVKAATL